MFNPAISERVENDHRAHPKREPWRPIDPVADAQSLAKALRRPAHSPGAGSTRPLPRDGRVLRVRSSGINGFKITHEPIQDAHHKYMREYMAKKRAADKRYGRK
jgi:hypothetical protein